MSRTFAPRAGAWIETFLCRGKRPSRYVAPRAGAWIETPSMATATSRPVSLPARERGLKRDVNRELMELEGSRSPRGSVD